MKIPLPLRPAQPQPNIATYYNWLYTQPSLTIHDATLSVQDLRGMCLLPWGMLMRGWKRQLCWHRWLMWFEMKELVQPWQLLHQLLRMVM